MRHRLFEFEDQQWCPAVLRNAITSYLLMVARMTRQAEPVIPAMAELLRRSGETRILDLCSGSGGITREVALGLAARGTPTPVTLSDLFPDTERLRTVAAGSSGILDVHPSPLDATEVPASAAGLRTMFNAFHHFEPARARGILAAAAEAGRPIAIIEFLERSPLSLAGVLFSPLLVLALTPWLRPRQWQTLVLTYAVPIVPLMIFWDGLASWLRVYSVAELNGLAASVEAKDYCWSAGKWRVGPVRVTYLLGYRRDGR
jgi:hypothetical protein